ncbi:MAG: hypothetical protein R3B95_04065 [Nitrospirales bacterium]|nr:hypothetical protein [Nitrospirales bacterium]
MPASFPTNRSHAVVIGCSFAGLLAARILSDHFERVTIFERDPVHDYPEARRGQAQTRHLHGLLAQGFRLLNRLFPHLESTLVQGGAVVSDMGESIRWYHHNGYKLQFPSGLSGVSMSRVFLEWEIRKAVLDLPNVTLRASCTVSRLVTTPDRSRVVGVELASEEHQGPTPIIQADFVVNTGGRGSATGKWLEGLGYSRPREEEITVGVGYATRIYRRRPDDLIGANLVMTSPTPPYQNIWRSCFLWSRTVGSCRREVGWEIIRPPMIPATGSFSGTCPLLMCSMSFSARSRSRTCTRTSSTRVFVGGTNG